MNYELKKDLPVYSWVPQLLNELVYVAKHDVLPTFIIETVHKM